MVNRLIKFKVWNEIEKKMYDSFNLNRLIKIRGKFIPEVITCFRKGTIFLQFTGLYDKNKKEIYEGDILTDRVGNWTVAVFSNGGFSLSEDSEEWLKEDANQIKEFCLKDYEGCDKLFDCEIIGNKYEGLKNDM